MHIRVHFRNFHNFSEISEIYQKKHKQFKMKVSSLILLLVSSATAKMTEVPMEYREIAPGVHMPVSRFFCVFF